MLVGLFDFRNLIHMLEGHRPSDTVTRLSSTLFDPGRFLEEMRCRRRFRRERERSVGADGDNGRYWQARFDMCRPGVEFLAEIHRFHALRSQRWTNGRCWSRFSSRD